VTRNDDLITKNVQTKFTMTDSQQPINNSTVLLTNKKKNSCCYYILPILICLLILSSLLMMKSGDENVDGLETNFKNPFSLILPFWLNFYHRCLCYNAWKDQKQQKQFIYINDNNGNNNMSINESIETIKEGIINESRLYFQSIITAQQESNLKKLKLEFENKFNSDFNQRKFT
jgi:hypothetical protein